MKNSREKEKKQGEKLGKLSLCMPIRHFALQCQQVSLGFSHKHKEGNVRWKQNYHTNNVLMYMISHFKTV